MKILKNTLLLLIIAYTLSSCTLKTSELTPNPTPSSLLIWDIKTSPLNGLPLRDNDLPVDVSVKTLYITIYSYTENREQYHFNDLERLNEYQIDNNPRVEVLVQEGDINGPIKGSFGYGESRPNALMQVRGHSTRRHPQKSYKISLYDRAGLFLEQQTLNLNKHPYDSLRIRNKLGFDLLKNAPDLLSLKTNFVHVFIKDLSGEVPDSDFVDYGLFTNVEQPNKRFLRSHRLDENGNLYKAEMFEFFKYEDILKSENSIEFDLQKFESILEIKEGNNHSKLISMLDDINNYNLDINDVFYQHFNLDNYLSFMAFNILIGNYDTKTQNFLLYSPQNATTWYFVNWDLDGSFRSESFGQKIYISPKTYGLQNYWGGVLHRRFFKDPNNVTLLSNKIEEFADILSADAINVLTQKYRPVINEYLFSLPDITYLRSSADSIENELSKLPEIITNNKSLYYTNLERPMPFFIGEPKLNNNSITILWDESFDLQNDQVFYDFIISKDPNFTQIVYKQTDIIDTSIQFDILPSGYYYVKVLARDDKGNDQIAFDTYIDGFGEFFFGVKKIYIN